MSEEKDLTELKRKILEHKLKTIDFLLSNVKDSEESYKHKGYKNFQDMSSNEIVRLSKIIAKEEEKFVKKYPD